jgi:hypothetical protein
MKMTGVLVLAIVALTLGAGCASGPLAVDSTASGGSMGTASPPTLWNQVPDCRNSGSYNRAANLCVSHGP